MLKRIGELKQQESHLLDNKGELDRNTKVGKPLGRLPNWTRNINTNKNNTKVNRYLMYQENRIMKAVELKQFHKATLIGLILLKNSFSYQLCLFNKVMPQGHYLLNYREAKLLMQKIANKCRCNDLGLELRRFYILKADGKRGRPIGCPDYPSRVISRSLNDLIYVLFEDKFNKVQHGFRRNRGAHTAILDIVNKLKKSPTIVYEFDLKSYFNTVRPMGVYRSLLSRSSILAELIYKIIMQIKYKLPSEVDKGEIIEFKSGYVRALIAQPVIQIVLIYMLGIIGLLIGLIGLAMFLEQAGLKPTKGIVGTHVSKMVTGRKVIYNVIKPERELQCKRTEPMTISTKKGDMEIDAPYIIREGLPQGLSISPVLATLTMEMFKNPDELTLYADDGVYIGNNIDKFNQGKQDVSLVGAELAESKSRLVTTGMFKFLGCIIDMEKENVVYKGKVISGNDELLAEKLMRLYSEEPYKKQPKGGTGKIKNDSVTAMNFKELKDLGEFPIGDYFLVVGNSVMGGLPHKGYRKFRNYGIIDILGASSFACNELVKSKSELNLVAIKPLSPIFKGKLSNYCVNKNTYYEEIYENSLRHYIKTELPGGNNVLENYGELKN